MNRGDVVILAARGVYAGKPRPALVVQSDLFNPTHASITLCLITSDLREAPLFRVTIDPSASNGLKKRSQVMVDKVLSAPRERIAEPIGRLDAESMERVDRALSTWLQL